MKKHFFSLSIALLFSSALSAQQFRYRVLLETPANAGLYKVALEPQWLSKMNADYRDVRLRNAEGKEIPYAIREMQAPVDSLKFIGLKINSNKHLSTYTELIIENPRRQLLSSLAFKMGNSDAVKYCALEGSNDLKQWYSISARQSMQLVNSENTALNMKEVNFPASDHRYLRLLFDDYNSRPFDIREAGYYENERRNNDLISFPLSFKYTEMIRGKRTEVRIHSQKHLLHGLDIVVKSPRLFKRQIELYRVNGTQTDLIVTQTIMHSTNPIHIDLPGLQAEELLLFIDNGDNQALELTSITGLQKKQWLMADMDSVAYELVFGGTENKSTNYDIGAFISNDFLKLPTLKAGVLKTIPVLPAPIPAVIKPAFYEQPYFMWLCIATGAVIAIFFSVNLLKDMKKEA